MSRFRFIGAEKAAHPVSMLCQVLEVSRASYYAWPRRGVSARAEADRQLTEQIRQVHVQSRATYGAPRVHADLAAAGVRAGRKRVARLMRAAGLVGCRRGRRAVRTTVADPAATPAPNLVAQNFSPAALERLWVGDIS